ncbi:MAG TPA: PilN domain-containing protein [Pseudomonadales bacterium]
MANINLLPWREKERERRKKAFFAMLGGAAALAGAILGAGHLYMQNEINNQNARNAYLQEQIAVLDNKIAEIRNLQDQKRALTERMAVIQDLQGRRPVIVRLFDELVRTLPEGVYYDRVTRTGDLISLEGVADSNNRVSTLMRYLEDSEWFAEPSLRQITAAQTVTGVDGQQTASNAFQLNVRVTAGDATDEEATP